MAMALADASAPAELTAEANAWGGLEEMPAAGVFQVAACGVEQEAEASQA